jgi:FixJ family two-component response regulator
VLSDVLMPGVGGIELAHRLLEHDADVRIVFMSCQVSLDALQEEFRGARLDVLPKPFSTEQLLRQVQASLERFPEPAYENSGANIAFLPSQGPSNRGV